MYTIDIQALVQQQTEALNHARSLNEQLPTLPEIEIKLASLLTSIRTLRQAAEVTKVPDDMPSALRTYLRRLNSVEADLQLLHEETVAARQAYQFPNIAEVIDNA